jgi:hypothetical protein
VTPQNDREHPPRLRRQSRRDLLRIHRARSSLLRKAASRPPRHPPEKAHPRQKHGPSHPNNSPSPPKTKLSCSVTIQANTHTGHPRRNHLPPRNDLPGRNLHRGQHYQRLRQLHQIERHYRQRRGRQHRRHHLWERRWWWRRTGYRPQKTGHQ